MSHKYQRHPNLWNEAPPPIKSATWSFDVYRKIKSEIRVLPRPRYESWSSIRDVKWVQHLNYENHRESVSWSPFVLLSTFAVVLLQFHDTKKRQTFYIKPIFCARVCVTNIKSLQCPIRINVLTNERGILMQFWRCIFWGPLFGTMNFVALYRV